MDSEYFKEDQALYSRVSQTKAFESASTNYKLGLKGLVDGDPDLLAARELAYIWARSQHAIRNNGWAAAALIKYRTNMGFINVTWKTKNGKVHKAMQKLWDEFVKNPNYDGYGTLQTTQDIWNTSQFSSGEAISRFVIKRRPGVTVPLAIQTIQPEYLNPSYYGTGNDFTRNGITFKDGVPFLYNFMENYDNSNLMTYAGKYVQVPASEISHIFIRNRPNQWRGIPVLTPGLISLYKLEDLTDATIGKQIAAQSVSWIIKNTKPTAAAALGNTVDVVLNNEKKTKTTITKSSDAGVHYLNEGEDIAFSQGADIGNNLRDLIVIELHKIAQSSYLTYESLVGDLTGVSFSGIKGAGLELTQGITFNQKLLLIDLGLAPLCSRFKVVAQAVTNKNLSEAEPSFELPERQDIDYLKKLQAKVLEIQSGLGSWGEELGRRLLTPEQIAEDRKLLREAGLLHMLDIANGTMNQTSNSQANSNSTSL